MKTSLYLLYSLNWLEEQNICVYFKLNRSKQSKSLSQNLDTERQRKEKKAEGREGENRQRGKQRRKWGKVNDIYEMMNMSIKWLDDCVFYYVPNQDVLHNIKKKTKSHGICIKYILSVHMYI